MIIPAAMNIYAGQDSLKTRSIKINSDELKELRDSSAGSKCENQSDFEYGYLLGLETARCILIGMPAIYQAGLKPENLL